MTNRVKVHELWKFGRQLFIHILCQFGCFPCEKIVTAEVTKSWMEVRGKKKAANKIVGSFLELAEHGLGCNGTCTLKGFFQKRGVLTTMLLQLFYILFLLAITKGKATTENFFYIF